MHVFILSVTFVLARFYENKLSIACCAKYEFDIGDASDHIILQF